MPSIERGSNPPATFLKCQRFSLMSFFSISEHPPAPPPFLHGEWGQSSRGMKESSDRDSCELQPLFQKRGLGTTTEPPPPPPPSGRPHSPQSVLTHKSAVQKASCTCPQTRGQPTATQQSVPFWRRKNGSKRAEHALPVCSSLRMTRREKKKTKASFSARREANHPPSVVSG